MSRPTFALLPLDDRPPNFQFPRRLAAIGGFNLRLPPRERLGRFLRPGDPEALWGWLEAAAVGADAVIVSGDMLAYGGLVASRTTAAPYEVAAARVRRLQTLKARWPRLRVYAFAVIPRLGLTASSRRQVRWGVALARCQELSAKPALSRHEADELARLGETLPVEALAAHQAMRRRNLAVNRDLVTLAAQGALDFLVLAQEDAPPQGPHAAEQGELWAEAERLGAVSRVRIFPGADEQGLVLLARAAGQTAGSTAAVYPLYSTPGGAEAVALFEDRALRMTVAGQIDAAGLTLAPTEQEADLLLGLHSPPTSRQTDIGHASPASAPRAPFAQHLGQAARAGRPVALADVAYCNGADPALIRALEQVRALAHLAAFAGWNTAGNTIGCALAQAAAWLAGPRGRRSARAQAAFLFERLVDDYAYQSVVRLQAYAFAREQLGAWPLHLRRGRRAARAFVAERLGEMAGRLFAEHFAGARTDGLHLVGLKGLRVRLPWPRLFEVEVEASLEVE